MGSVAPRGIDACGVVAAVSTSCEGFIAAADSEGGKERGSVYQIKTAAGARGIIRRAYRHCPWSDVVVALGFGHEVDRCKWEARGSGDRDELEIRTESL